MENWNIQKNNNLYRIPGKMALVVNKAQKAPTIKSVIPSHIDSSDVIDLGNGLCRGPKWQSNNWPKDEGTLNFLIILNKLCASVHKSSKVKLFKFDSIVKVNFYNF